MISNFNWGVGTGIYMAKSIAYRTTLFYSILEYEGNAIELYIEETIIPYLIVIWITFIGIVVTIAIDTPIGIYGMVCFVMLYSLSLYSCCEYASAYRLKFKSQSDHIPSDATSGRRIKVYNVEILMKGFYGEFCKEYKCTNISIVPSSGDGSSWIHFRNNFDMILDTTDETVTIPLPHPLVTNTSQLETFKKGVDIIESALHSVKTEGNSEGMMDLV